MERNIYFYENLKEKLTDEEILEYFKLAKNGDKSARDKLIEYNLRLIIYVIERNFKDLDNSYPFIDKKDLMSMGIIGLITAVDTFSVEKGYSFSTYANTLIVNEILRFIRKHKNIKKNTSINDVIYKNKDGDNITYEDVINSSEDITSYYDNYESKIFLQKSLNILSDLERRIIKLYYGFNNKPINDNEISKLLGYSRTHINTVRIRAQKKLGSYLQNYGIGYIKKLSKSTKGGFNK